jgi:hypothetical protein
MPVTPNREIGDEAVSIRADLYFNLQDDVLSVRDRRSESDSYGTVVDHTDYAFIRDPTVVVYDSKRQQAVDGPKNVHAMLRGDVYREIGHDHFHPAKRPREIEYDVTHEQCFVWDGRGITSASAVEITVADGRPRIAATGIQYNE